MILSLLILLLICSYGLSCFSCLFLIYNDFKLANDFNKLGGEISYCIVNAFGPTQPRPSATTDHQLVTDFYHDLWFSTDVPSQHEVHYTPTEEELASDISFHIGRFTVGTRNSNGNCLVNFLVEHPSRDITTRTGWLKDYSSPNPHAKKPVAVYIQIDYIFCRTCSRRVLQASRC